jgi:S-adenosylmethionine:tRNA ribosyltransferase-isomerase
MKTSDFDYALPPELIAQTPLEPRDASRLMVLERRTGQLAHRGFRNLPEYLRAGDLLVANDSRVIPARLHAVKSTGGKVEIFLLRPARLDEATASWSFEHAEGGLAAMVDGGRVWECLVGGKGLRPGTKARIACTCLHLPAPARTWGAGTGAGAKGLASITATIIAETEAGSRLVAFDPPVAEWLWDIGQVPLPPYIHEPLTAPERYQTIYSRVDGSVASPTAGLHLTSEMLLDLKERGVRLSFVTLHIGLDTFRPVQAEEIEQHRIHREWAQINAETALAVNQTRLAGGRIVAVGTTAVRVLESAAKVALGLRPGDDIPDDRSCGWQTAAAFTGETDLFIRPGHRFRAVDAMITNFHLPRSTLLMLVSAFAGKELIDRAYAEAVHQRYRFYSFGDAMLIL